MSQPPSQRPGRERVPQSGAEPPRVWLVDGFNVLHAALTPGRDRGHWWSGQARRRLLERVAGFDDAQAEVVVVFDGRHPAPSADDGAPSQPRVVFAESADEWLLARVRADAAPQRLAVVTRDRRLAGRSLRRGARVVSPREFLARCQSTEPGPGES